MRISIRTLPTWILALAMCWAPQILAQPYTQDDSLKPFHLILEEDSDNSGALIGEAIGTLESEPQYLFVNGLSAIRAAQVNLIPLTDGSPIKLEVAKNNWESVLLWCEAKAGESCYLDFKTFPDAGFRVTGTSGSSWLLTVFTSPELSIADILPSPTYAANKADADKLASAPSRVVVQSDSDNNSLLLIIIALLAIIAAILLYFALRRNKALVGLLLLASIGIMHSSEPFADNIYYGGGLPGDPNQIYRPPAPGEIVNIPERDRASWVRMQRGRSDTAYKDITAFDRKVTGELGKVNKRYQALKSMRKLAQSWNDLSACSRIVQHSGVPRIPTFCEGNLECEQCYADARRDFDFVRGVLEQLRVVYKCTKSFSDDAIAFGDNVSGLHAVSGLAWQSARKEIQDSVKQLQKSYDKKYTQLMGSLERSMINMDSCEAEWGIPDWYDRFGFIYVEFMGDKYQRTD